MKRLEKELWEKVEDKNTSKDEYVDALYGLQALLKLQNLWERTPDLNYGKIKFYFDFLLIKRRFTDKGVEYIDDGKETRVSKEFKIYMQSRCRKWIDE